VAIEGYEIMEVRVESDDGVAVVLCVFSYFHGASILEAKLPDLTATGEFRLQPDGHPEGYVLVEQELQEAMRILCSLSAA